MQSDINIPATLLVTVTITLVGAFAFLMRQLAARFERSVDREVAAVKELIVSVKKTSDERYDRAIADAQRSDRSVATPGHPCTIAWTVPPSLATSVTPSMSTSRSSTAALLPIFLVVLADVFGFTLVFPLFAIYAESLHAILL
jgi:hypothetical protein